MSVVLAIEIGTRRVAEAVAAPEVDCAKEAVERPRKRVARAKILIVVFIMILFYLFVFFVRNFYLPSFKSQCVPNFFEGCAEM
jgi:hypothetical protein